MDLSTRTVLFLLGAIEIAACVGCALYWLIGRGAEARTPTRKRRSPARHAERAAPHAEPATRHAERAAHGTPAGNANARRAAPEMPTRWIEQRSPHATAQSTEHGSAGRGAPPDADADFPYPPGHPPEHSSGREEIGDTGRHHVPEELLQASTYKLTADRRARAKVPDVLCGAARAAELSRNVLRRSRTRRPARRPAAAEDIPLRS